MGQHVHLIKSPTQGGSFLAAALLVATFMSGLLSPALAADKNTLLTEVHFDIGSAAVTPGGEQKIRQAIVAIKEQNPSEIRIIGFTDSTGDEAMNREIAHNRAESVANLLVKQGITVPLVVEGRGEKGAPYKIADDISEPLNRCVGIIAVSKSKPTVEPLL
ncbi:MAG: OmpA family protein [Geminicoccaceae bacterium]